MSEFKSFPKNKKTKKKIRNPKPTAKDICIICGRPYAETHEVFFGKNSYLSKVHKMQARLCYECQRGTNGAHGKNGGELNRKLKKMYQRKFEETHSREEFMRIFGQNYLWDEEDLNDN